MFVCQNTHHSKIWLYMNTKSTKRTVNSFVCDLHSFLSFTKCSKYVHHYSLTGEVHDQGETKLTKHTRAILNSKYFFFHSVNQAKTYTWLIFLFTVKRK